MARIIGEIPLNIGGNFGDENSFRSFVVVLNTKHGK